MLTMNKIRSDILLLGKRYAAATGLALSTISKRAVSNTSLFDRVLDKRPVRLETYSRFVEFCHDNWPEDAEWPQDVERPVAMAHRKKIRHLRQPLDNKIGRARQRRQ